MYRLAIHTITTKQWDLPTAVKKYSADGVTGEGCIDIKGIRAMVEGAGFNGPIEVEIFSNRHWSRDPDGFFHDILAAYQKHV